jgi:hypothetical protein
MLKSILAKNGKALLGIAFSFLLSNASLEAAKVRHGWTPGEDQALRGAVGIYGAHNWATIAKQLPGRTGRQCQNRWIKVLNPVRVFLRREAVTRHGNPGAVADEVDPANPQLVPAVVPVRLPAGGNPGAVAGAADPQSDRLFLMDIRNFLNHHQ